MNMGIVFSLLLLLCQYTFGQSGIINLEDDDASHTVSWSLILPGPANINDAIIRFTLTWNRTKASWAAFAIGYGMSKADVFMTSIDDNGVTTLLDRYSKAEEVPAMDTVLGGKNDLIWESSAITKEGIASVTFLRKAVTGDIYDLPINISGPTGLIWAYGQGTAQMPQKHDDEGGDPDPSEGEAGLTCNFLANYTMSDSPQSIQLDTQFNLEWVVLSTNELRITFIWSNTDWAAIGFGKVMSGSDMIIVSVNSDGTNAMATDRYATGNTIPPLDTSDGSTNDVKLESATVSSSGVKKVTIRRALNTGDTKHDAVLSRSTPSNIIWALGPGTAMSPQQHSSRITKDTTISWVPAPIASPSNTGNSTKSNGEMLTTTLGWFIPFFISFLYSYIL